MRKKYYSEFAKGDCKNCMLSNIDMLSPEPWLCRDNGKHSSSSWGLAKYCQKYIMVKK